MPPDAEKIKINRSLAQRRKAAKKVFKALLRLCVFARDAFL
jgi:hypothetical protein